LKRRSTNTLKTGVIGVGHLGREHARVYASLESAELVAVCDIDEATGQAVAQRFGVPLVRDFSRLIGQVDAVSIATPTISHYQVAKTCLEGGIHALVEKPITQTLAEADELIALADDRGLTLQVGHIERFNPAFMALSRKITKPRFFEAHRMGTFTPRSLDIDVVMDLMVHEIDVISALVPSEVTKIDAVGIPILTQKVDMANARIEFADGCVANITASRVSGERLRKLRVFQPNEYYSLDYADQQVAACRLVLPTTPQGRAEIVAESLEVVRREPLLSEIEAFVTAAREGKPALVTGTDGRRALELALEVVRKIDEHAARR